MEIKVFTGAFIGSSKEVSFIVIYDLPWSAQEKLDDIRRGKKPNMQMQI